MAQISIIIVSWNTRDTTLNCLKLIYRFKPSQPLVEIILVDNGSGDGSVAAIKNKFPDVILISNRENLGYARANNQGMQLAKGEILLLLNSDTLLKDESTFSKIIQFFASHPQTGILGAKLVYPNGRLQAAGRDFISLKGLIRSQLLFASAPIFNKIKARKLAKKEFHFCDYVDGAFLAIRRMVLDEIGGLNEEFFMYGEDMEWCARARAKGWQVAVLHSLEVIHLHAESAKKNYHNILLTNTQNNCKLMYRYYGKWSALTAFYIYLLGMGLRIFVSCFRNRAQVKDYWNGLKACYQHRKTILKG